jgi:hypothetical protein
VERPSEDIDFATGTAAPVEQIVDVPAGAYQEAGFEARVLDADGRKGTCSSRSRWAGATRVDVLKEPLNHPVEKVVKFNELIANCVMYSTACDITDAANAIAAEGEPVDPADLARLCRDPQGLRRQAAAHVGPAHRRRPDRLRPACAGAPGDRRRHGGPVAPPSRPSGQPQRSVRRRVSP